MIVGLGTDLIALERAEAAWTRFGQRFAERILAPGERAVLARRADPVAYLARRPGWNCTAPPPSTASAWASPAPGSPWRTTGIMRWPP